MVLCMKYCGFSYIVKNLKIPQINCGTVLLKYVLGTINLYNLVTQNCCVLLIIDIFYKLNSLFISGS
jgi:hypothetical protein